MSKVPFQLLELSLISAQDLAPGPKNLSKTLKTYAVTWITPDRKLRTGTDRNGHNNPTWNQKFIFRVENNLMDSESTSVMIEIYAAGWLKPSLIGYVSVLMRDLIPPSARQERRVVALQVRRHSGRPQGILSMGVALLDNTMKSMPLCTAFTGPAVGINGEEKTGIRLTRSLSDQTLLRTPGEGKKKKGGSMCNIAAAASGSGGGGGGCDDNNEKDGCSALGGSLNSDIGPSPSVVAFAVAHGLYPLQQGPPPQNPGSSVLKDWTMQGEPSIAQMRPGYQRLVSSNNNNNKKKQTKRSRRRSSGDAGDGDGRLSCFGNACGCEFNVVYGRKGEKQNQAPPPY